jgi:uncharacterized protein YdeI (YjbR/CyaY-like superfamily)
MTDTGARLFKGRAGWRRWLEKNHAKSPGIWLAYYKVDAGKKSVRYEEALEEALCFGWIDSTVRRLDHERYMQKYTPRKEASLWSAANKARVARLIDEGRMTEAGLAKIRAAKSLGTWTKLDRIDRDAEVPGELLHAMEAEPSVKALFEKLPPSQKKLWSWWIVSAKRPETRDRRIVETIRRVAAGRKAGM